ncbi:MAG: hypothetical protein NPIRA02_11040 [Nitrospirales bacterium]|nr:MAG: hypothetical protein NPIRA02_11040 [Nitrospirales bacterium]
MYRVLRWIERMDWHKVVLRVFMCSFTLTLVFAGSLNTSTEGMKKPVGERTAQKIVPDELPPTFLTQAASLRREFLEESKTSRGSVPLRSRQSETSEEISLLLDLSKNILMVKKGSHIIHTALAATGSGKVLRDPLDPSRTWTFETPTGRFTIESKLEKPVWIRPDWAFIEKGMPVPEDPQGRQLPNVLGDYALGFGDGYFIHGALYTYLLGFNVTHGCIQVNDEDLQYIFETVPLGATLVIV